MNTFEYYEPKNVNETLDMLASGEDTRVLAGGCGILEIMKHKLYTPKALVNIKNIQGLKYVRNGESEITIGTLATQTEVKDSPVVKKKIPILSEALGFVATPRIRNMATIGGTIVHADPNSDVAPALLVLESRVRVETREGPKEIAMDSVYRDYFETCIVSSELLGSIIIPVPPTGCKGIYTRFSVRKSMDKAMPGVAVLVDLEDDKKTIRKVRIAVSGVGSTPLRLKEEEDYLSGKVYHPEVASRISDMIKRRIEPIQEHHYSTEYKKEVTGIMLKRAVANAISRAGVRA